MSSLASLSLNASYNKVASNYVKKFPNNSETDIKKLLRIASVISQIPEDNVKNDLYNKAKSYFNAQRLSKMFSQLTKGPASKVNDAIIALDHLGIEQYEMFKVYENLVDRARLGNILHDKYYGRDKKLIDDILIERDKHEEKYGAVSEDVVMKYITQSQQLKDKNGNNIYIADTTEYIDKRGGVSLITTYTEKNVGKPILTTYNASLNYVNFINNKIKDLDKDSAANVIITETMKTTSTLVNDEPGSRAIALIRFSLYDLDQEIDPFTQEITLVRKNNVMRGGSLKVYSFNTLTMAINSKDEYVLKGKPATLKEIHEENVNIFLKKVASTESYWMSDIFKYIEIRSIEFWHFSVPYGGCFGSYKKIKGLLNVSDKYFNGDKDERNRCFYHCVLVHLVLTSKSTIPLQKCTSNEDPSKPPYYPVALKSNPDLIVLNSIAKKLGFPHNEPLSLTQASLFIRELNKELNGDQKINEPISIVDLKELKAHTGSIVYFDDHYFLWDPPSLRVSKIKEADEKLVLQKLKTKEQVRAYLESNLTERQIDEILNHKKFDKKGQYESMHHYISISYDYECKRDTDGLQIPTQCGYKIPAELDDETITPSIILNEHGSPVSSIKYKVECSRTPGLDMVKHIMSKTTSKFMEKYLCEDGSVGLKMKKEYESDKVKLVFNAFNGSNYDSIILINELLSGGAKVVNTQTCFHQGKMMRTTFQFTEIPGIIIILFDIARFTMGSLDDNGRNFKVPALKGSFDYSLIDFKENMTEENFTKLNRYLLHDVFVLDSVTDILRNYYAKLFYVDIYDFVSLPQMTYDYFKNHYCPLNVLLPSSLKEDKFYRKAAYGGIVFNYHRSYESKRYKTKDCLCYQQSLESLIQQGKISQEELMLSDHDLFNHIMQQADIILPECTGMYIMHEGENRSNFIKKVAECDNKTPQCLFRCNNFSCNDVLVPYDVNSLYPAACLREFPCGRARSFYWNDLEKDIQEEYYSMIFTKPFKRLAILSAFIEVVPEEFNEKVKIFPKRGKKGMSCRHKVGEKLHLTSEQFYHMMRYGYLFKIHKVTYWEDKDILLDAFMKNYYEARQVAKEDSNTILEQIIKLILNSLTGKFLQRNMDSNSIFINDPKKIRDIASKDNIETIFQLDGKKISNNELSGETSMPWLFIRTYKDESVMDAAKPSHLSAFLLSHSKTIMLEYMEQFQIVAPPNLLEKDLSKKGSGLGPNFNALYYMDTDSFYINRQGALSSGFKETTNLGGMKNDLGSISAFIDRGAFLGKKMYLTEKYDIKDLKPDTKTLPEYKISSKGITKPRKINTKLLDTLLQKKSKGASLNIVEEETISQLYYQKEKYECDMEKVVTIFNSLKNNGIAVVDGLLKFQKSFKGDSPLTIKVEDVTKVISSKCTCETLESFIKQNPNVTLKDKNMFAQAFQSLHPNGRNSRKCPLLLQKIKDIKKANKEN